VLLPRRGLQACEGRGQAREDPARRALQVRRAPQGIRARTQIREGALMRINFKRLDAQEHMDLIGQAIDAAEEQGLEAEVTELLGERLRQIMIQREGRKAAAGVPSLFEALPSVIEAREGAA